MKRENLYRLAALLLAAVLLLTACVQPPQDPTDGTQGTSEEPSSTVTQPTDTQPTQTDPTDPQPTDPIPTDPQPTDPQPTDPQPTQPTQPKPTEPDPTRPTPTVPDLTGAIDITLSFTGDCTFGRNQKASYTRSFDEMYDNKGAKYFFNKVRHIFENDDITVINLEGSLTTSTDIQDKMWNHKGDPKYVNIMTTSSVEVATMGNNHRLDYGVSGFEETMDVLEKAQIDYCYDGVYLAYEVKGIKVGFVSVNVVYDGLAVRKWLKEGYQQLRDQGCSIVVACIHWGGDKTPVIEDYQVNLGHEVIDWGYDLVVGNHPHVLQAMEVYKGKFICYSLGNFCYGGNKNPPDKDSGIFQQTFTFVDGVLVEDYNAQFIPCSLSGVDYRNDYQPTPSKGSEYKRIIEKMNGYSSEYGFALDSDGRPAMVDGKYVAVHVHEFEDKGTVAATCTEQGYHLRACICGMEERTELVEPLGHQFGEFVSNGDGSCTTDGTKTAECANCGTQVTVTDVIAPGHKYEITSVTAPTMWEEGYTTYTCAGCGESYMGDFIPCVPREEFQRMVAAEAVKYINQLRTEQELAELVPAAGLTLVAEYRATQLSTAFEHSEDGLREACNAYQYGDLTETEDYSIVATEAIVRFVGGTTPEQIGQQVADLLQNSEYWVGICSAEALNLGIGAAYDADAQEWFICVLQTVDNYG